MCSRLAASCARTPAWPAPDSWARTRYAHASGQPAATAPLSRSRTNTAFPGPLPSTLRTFVAPGLLLPTWKMSTASEEAERRRPKQIAPDGRGREHVTEVGGDCHGPLQLDELRELDGLVALELAARRLARLAVQVDRERVVQGK